MLTPSALLRKAVIVTVLVLAASFACGAQITSTTDATQTPVAGANHDYVGMLNETVSPESGTVSVNIKVPVPPGRKVNLPFSFQYSSGGALFAAANWQLGWGAMETSTTAPLTAGGWSYALPQVNRAWKMYTIPPLPQSPDGSTTCGTTLGYTFTDTNGTQHNLNMAHVYNKATSYACTTSGFPQWETDTGGDSIVLSALAGPISGGTFIPPSDGGVNVADPDGTVYYLGEGGLTPQASPNSAATPLYSIKDRNGNSISIAYTQYQTGNQNVGETSGFTITDTLGRAAVVASNFGEGASTVSVSGLSQPYTATWSNWHYNGYVVNTQVATPNAGGCSGSGGQFQFQSGTEPVISSLALPNGQQYVFTYDPKYGTLQTIKYPSGGTVAYTYNLSSLSTSLTTTDSNLYNTCYMNLDTAAVATRTVTFDGSTNVLEQDFAYTTNYGNGPNNVWTSKQTTVTTHDLVRGTSFQTVYNYAPLSIWCGPNGGGGNCGIVGVESSIVYKDTNGAVLETVTKGWYDQYEEACEFRQLGSSGPISGVFYTYGPGGQITDKKEYDYGLTSTTCTAPTTPAPTRETVTTYQSGFPTPTAFAGPIILDRPSTVKVYAGSSASGTLMGETDYTYDGGTPTVGNATRIVKRCLQAAPACSSGDSVTTYSYDSHGQVISTTDARNNTTQFSYTDVYSSCNGAAPPSSPSDAYLTQITYPQTNGVNHIVSFCYGYDDGQLRGSTDQNGLTTTNKYVDNLGRLTETDSPDGGKTTFIYSDAPTIPTVTTSRVMNSSQTMGSAKQMDGAGHPVFTYLISDPQGTIYTHTVYDGLGRVYQVYNPYRSTSDPTYGYTTYVYDALGRTTQVTKPDNSVVTTQYSFDQTRTSTMVTDEAGNQRRSFTDGLGRLVEVDEPGAGTTIPASQSKGSVTISGAVQSKQVVTQQPTSGTGTITITGSEQSYYFDPCRQHGGGSCPTTYYDTGSWTVTVNGFNGYAYWNQGDTPGSVASYLATTLNTGSSPVTATVNGNVVTLKAKATGTASNYPLSVSLNWSNNGGYFSSPSFTATRSGPALTGGMNIGYGTIYDHGTISVTLNVTDRKSAAYGQGDTLSSVISRLVSAFAGDSLVTVVSGANGITLTSIAAGGSTNYPLSVSVTYDSADFPSPSFAAGAIGMEGGMDSHPGLSLSTPAVTLYSYDALGNLDCAVQKASDTSAFNPLPGTSTPCGSPAPPAAWRARSFTYDSLNRLTSSYNPEAGSVTYTYDANSNVLTKTDARNITANYSPSTSPIDALNRITMVTYSDGTPTVKFGYDGIAGTSGCNPTISGGYPTDHRTSMCDAAGSESLSYTITSGTGWKTSESRTTNGVTKTTTTQNNLAGQLISLTYPSGRIITYTYDSAGRPSLAQDTANGINYAFGTCANGVGSNGVCYAAAGVSQIQNGANLVSTYIYNNRLQPCWMYATTGTPLPASALCITQESTPGNILDLQYNFNLGMGDNGNVMGIANNRDCNRTQIFTYDPLNRIASGQSPSNCTSRSWSQTYSYDAWGNLLLPGLTVGTNNRITNFNYNAAGDELNDATNSYAWDADSEMTTANGVGYTYNGDGNRMMKSSGKIYWYGAGTEILDESDGSGTIASEYVFFGGKRIARRDIASGYIYYYEEDMLGSSRTLVQAGQTSLCYDADFYPFGGELQITTTCSQNYKFEGKERDTETGNDDFGARYYSSVYGRWLSADWSSVPAPVPYANMTNPQTLNLYAMVSDNPESFADLDGHAVVCGDATNPSCDQSGGMPNDNPIPCINSPLSNTPCNPLNGDPTPAPSLTTSTQQDVSFSAVGPMCAECFLEHSGLAEQKRYEGEAKDQVAWMCAQDPACSDPHSRPPVPVSKPSRPPISNSNKVAYAMGLGAPREKDVANMIAAAAASFGFDPPFKGGAPNDPLLQIPSPDSWKVELEIQNILLLKTPSRPGLADNPSSHVPQ